MKALFASQLAPPNKRARVGRPSLDPSRRASPAAAAVQPHSLPAARARALAGAGSAAVPQPHAAAAQLPPAPEAARKAADTTMSAAGVVMCDHVQHAPVGPRSS